MLIKSCDDHSKRLRLLDGLRKSDRLDERQKDWLRSEYQRLAPGLAGERDAAHYLDMSVSNGKNHAVLHDLRLEADGQTAQIDHLIVDRTLTFFLLETKTYRGSLHINEHGEFMVEYSGERRYGIESPLEQSRRHETVLRKTIKRVEIVGRAGIPPRFVHVVMVHPKAIIHRPLTKKLDTSMVIKADQFTTWHSKFIDTANFASDLVGIASVRGRNTVKEWGEKLKGEHRPTDPLWLPDFMKPKLTSSIPPRTAVKVPSPVSVSENNVLVAPLIPVSEIVSTICETCGKALTQKAVQYCLSKAKVFDGKLYCFAHQKTAKSG